MLPNAANAFIGLFARPPAGSQEFVAFAAFALSKWVRLVKSPFGSRIFPGTWDLAFGNCLAAGPWCLVPGAWCLFPGFPLHFSNSLGARSTRPPYLPGASAFARANAQPSGQRKPTTPRGREG